MHVSPSACFGHDSGFARTRWLPAALLLALAAIMPTAAAQSVVIYRCTDGKGALTIQNGTPCPKGSKQERRVIEAAPSRRRAALRRAGRPAPKPDAPPYRASAGPDVHRHRYRNAASA